MIGTLLTALAGLGLVLFGLRVFTAALDEAIVARLKPWVARWTVGTSRTFASGLLATVGLQASAITVVASMGLLERGLLTLEQGIVVMLGATAGTSLKALLVALPYELAGPAVVGLTSLALAVARRHLVRRALEALLAVGLMFLGWHLVARDLGPVFSGPEVGAHLAGLSVETLPGLMFTIAVGFGLTAMVQSSSIVVFLVLGLVALGAVGFPVGAALVLGANVGTTLTPLYASLEYTPAVRRLAVAHVIVKGLGVAFAGLFFRSFLLLVTAVTAAFAAAPTDLDRVAAAHVLFNALNAALWLPAAGPLAHFLRVPSPTEGLEMSTVLTAPVRRLLAGVPEEALEEVLRERDGVLVELKMAIDRIIEVMSHGDDPSGARPSPALWARITAAEEMMATLIARQGWSAAFQDPRRELDVAEQTLDELDDLALALERESNRLRDLRRVHLAPRGEALRAGFDAIWGRLLGVATPEVASDWFEALEREVYAALREARADEAELLGALHQLGQLRRIEQLVKGLADRRG